MTNYTKNIIFSEILRNSNTFEYQQKRKKQHYLANIKCYIKITIFGLQFGQK